MKNRKQIMPKEVVDSLKISIKYNDEAVDYFRNIINRKSDEIKYNSTNELQEELNILTYTEAVLKTVGIQYRDSLKKFGGIS